MFLFLNICQMAGENRPPAYVCFPAVAPHRRDYQERQIEAGRIDKPPPSAHSAGGSAVFHKYMYVVYLLFKSKDKAAVAEI